MKVSSQQLKRIIKEEVQKELLKEADDPYFYTKKISAAMVQITRGIDQLTGILSSPYVARHPQTKGALKAYENLEVANSNAMKIVQPILDVIRKKETERAGAIKGEAG